jgi:hypothetical protein
MNMITMDVSAITIQGVGSNSIALSNDTSVIGPVLLLNNSILLANLPQFGLPVQTLESNEECVNEPGSVFHNWTRSMLGPLSIVEPPPEILVVGSGSRMHRFPALLSKLLSENGITVEVQATVL